jgi:hypothetical protein
MVTLAIPANANGAGYVCYARPAHMGAFPVHAIVTTQDYEGAGDLDIRPAVENRPVTVCRVFVEAGTEIAGELFFDNSRWTKNTTIQLQLLEEGGALAAKRVYTSATPQGTPLSFKATQKGFHAFVIQSANTPAQNQAPSYRLRANYTAPQTF